MKSKASVSAIVAMSLALGGPASVFAQAGVESDWQASRSNPANQPEAQHGKQAPGQRGHPQQSPSGYAQRGDGRPDARGAGPEHNYHRGDRLPAQYRHHNYVVDDWRGHGLNAPPRGYQWVQNGNDYLLIAIATGLIVQLLLNN